MSKPSTRPFTGWHMLAMMVAFFGVVIAVNSADRGFEEPGVNAGNIAMLRAMAAGLAAP